MQGERFCLPIARMPLSRFQLRNEYGLGVRELYSEASKKEDPKAVLDGVAVAGLVGLLRQLGDLAEFAADVFHGLQEDITTTSSRSRKLMTRVKHIEAVLPPLEKAMLSQTSHIHFAYTPGTEWHPRIRAEQNHFIYTDLPRCVVDSYEECKEPPRLQLLDKYEIGGPGSCLKRYSDPAFFRRASGNSSMNDEKSKKERKARKAKKRRSWKRSSQLSFDAPTFSYNGRVQISSPPRQRKPSPTQTVSTFDMTFKSDLVDRSDSPGSGDGMGFIECVFHPSASVQTDETKSKQSPSVSGDKLANNLKSKYPGKQTVFMNDDSPRSSIVEKNGHSSSTDTWDEKVDLHEHIVQHSGSLHETGFEFGRQEIDSTVWKSGNDEVQELHEPTFQFDEPDIEPIGWNLRSYEVPEFLETNFEPCDPDIEPVGRVSSESTEMAEVHEKNFQIDDQKLKPSDENYGDNERLELYETNLQHDEQEIEESLNLVCTSFESVNSPNLTLDKNQPDEVESETDNFVDALNTIESESENEFDYQRKGELGLCSHLKDDFQDDVDDERIADNIHDQPPSVSCNDLDLCDSTSSLLSAYQESLQHTPGSHDVIGRELCEDPKSFAPSVHSDVDAPLQGIQSSSVQDVSSGISFTKDYGNADGLQEESIGKFESSEFEATSIMAGIDERIIHSPRVSEQEQPSVKSSNVDPVAIWTNGGLLGLQPSKPPDFSTSGRVYINNSISVSHLNQNLKPADDNLQEKLDSSANDSRCDYGNAKLEQLTSVSDNCEIDSSKKPPLQLLNSGLDKKLNNPVDVDLSRISAHSQSQLLPTIIHPEAKAHRYDDYRDTSNEASHVNDGRSSFFTGLGHGLLRNGFRRTRSMEYNEIPKAVGFEKTHGLENTPHATLHRSSSGTKLRQETPSPLNSAPPSPPLEHMKMSFQPINSFGSSKLKLKYPEGINHLDEISDSFPSFQLVPEPALKHGIDSDSDDDTFCRSNPYISDDELSHLSDSNSELWESGSSESRDQTSHNRLCRISSGESLSNSAELDEMKNTSINDGFGSSHVPDIPVLQTMNPFGFQETEIGYDPKAAIESPFNLGELNLEPPPLPPLQWRVSRSQSDLLQGKGSISGFMSLFSGLKDPGSSFPHPVKPASDVLFHTANEHVNVTPNNKQLGEQNLKANAWEKINRVGNVGKVVDERDDFLHQIRTKSFNLRKTGLLKPAPTPVAPPPSVKVTAILEKANAIRQAVGSDDGDDDPWSDT